MKLTKRSFPYPVLGNGDDVLDAAIQSVLEVSSDQENYYIDVTINCSSKTITNLIGKKHASYSVHVGCSNTVFRKAFEFYENKQRISIPHSELNDAVEVNVFVCARKTLPDYRIDGAHEDYGKATFSIQEGDMLALAGGSIFYAEPQNDSMKNIASIMQIQVSNKDGDLPMEIDLNGDKICVTLSKSDFESYTSLMANKFLAGQISTLIVLPALIETLHQIEGDEAGFSANRWYRCLMARIKALSLEEESDLFVKAQKILELPVRRSLTAAKAFVDSVN